MAEQLLSTQDVCAKLSVSRGTLAKLRKEAAFPKPLDLVTNGQKHRFRERDVDEWIAFQQRQQGDA